MILFERDWARFPGAIVDTLTSNRSWVIMSQKLKQAGIRNYYFFLALMQPALQGVDPHSPDLTAQQMHMVAQECRYNPWYYFREVCRVPPKASSIPAELELNRGNLAMWWCFFAHLLPCLIQPRQTGKSLSVGALQNLLMLFMCNNTTINMITKDSKARTDEVIRLKELRGLLPLYLRQIDNTDADNTHAYTVNKLNNKYRTYVAQTSIADAGNTGRGSTAPIAHCDEGPFTKFIYKSLGAMLSAGGAARDEARKHGTPYGTIITTTAGAIDTDEGKFMYDIIHGGMVWNEALYDCANEADAHAMVENNSFSEDVKMRGVVNITMSHTQLGKSDAWLRQKISETPITPDEANRDYFNIWTSGSLSSPLSKALMRMIRGSVAEPTWSEVSKDGYLMKWYTPKDGHEQRMANNSYVLGMDTSEAIGRDGISMVIVDTKTLEVVGAALLNETNLIRFTAYVADFMIKYTTVTLIPERRSTGGALVDTLLLRLPAVGIDPFKRIYNTVVDNNRWDEPKYRQASLDVARRPTNFYDLVKGDFGFVTSGGGQHSRNQLYGDTLQEAARKGGAFVRDKKLADEILGLVTKNDKIDHKSGGHDDMVIAWLLAVWMLTLSRNLNHYGITGALSRVREANVDGVISLPKTAADERREQHELAAREEIDHLMQQLSTAIDDMVVMRIESRIRFLDGRVGGSGLYGEGLSLDTLISNTKAARTKRVRERMRERSGSAAGFRRVA